MRIQTNNFDQVLNNLYKMSLEERLEIRNLLDHNIAETRRKEILKNYKLSQEEHENGALQFSSSIDELKKML